MKLILILLIASAPLLVWLAIRHVRKMDKMPIPPTAEELEARRRDANLEDLYIAAWSESGPEADAIKASVEQEMDPERLHSLRRRLIKEDLH